MTNTQFLALLLTGIGLFLTLLATQIGGFYFLTTRLDTLGNRLDGRIDRIGDDLRQFYRTLGQHDSRLDAIEKHPS